MSGTTVPGPAQPVVINAQGQLGTASAAPKLAADGAVRQAQGPEPGAGQADHGARTGGRNAHGALEIVGIARGRHPAQGPV